MNACIRNKVVLIQLLQTATEDTVRLRLEGKTKPTKLATLHCPLNVGTVHLLSL